MHEPRSLRLVGVPLVNRAGPRRFRRVPEFRPQGGAPRMGPHEGRKGRERAVRPC
ncbi:hypothetical protein Lokhon_00174 [Limimaricola hongkongensis DSM 17492]|uniref:Uncharacterized protein n=1 Tax=Limimaricola hongkongensis DSM 17492 TaxID=1122180 RepID=A0A017HH02_9RHOB|nr:hypothetical protein Lokhon_00174 [Limimaricola hongkongensis DSM 17492]